MCSGQAYSRIDWVLRKLPRPGEGRELMIYAPALFQTEPVIGTEAEIRNHRGPTLEELILCKRSSSFTVGVE